MQPVSSNNPLIKRARQEAVFLAPTLLDRCLAAALEALAESERHTGSVPLRLQIGEALRGLEKRRPALRAAFAARLDDAIAQALAHARESDAQAPSVELDELSLALVDDAEVARFVESSRLQQAAMPVVEQTLTRLDSLMSSALGLPVVRADLNPLRPDVLCGALLALLDAQPEPPELRAHWVRQLARPYAQALEQLYRAVVELLQAQGVEEARYRLKLTEPGALLPASGPGPAQGMKGVAAPGGAGPGLPGAPVGAPDLPEAERARQRRALFPRMHDLAQARPAVPQALIRDFLYRPQWVAENDEPLPAQYYEAVQQQAAQLGQAPLPAYDAATAARTRARAQALAVVDRPARAVSPELPLPPEQWGEAASAQARAQTLVELKGQARKISQVLGLDAVRTLVSQVAGDERVLAPVREAFVALEPALLRMALADPRFFGDDQHPARRLIEQVAQRSFKYNDEYADEFEQFMAPVRQAVGALNAAPAAAADDFAKRLQALETDWRQQDEQEQAGHDPGLRSMRFAQERQALADKIAWEFSLRSDLQGVPAVVADFLFHDWSLVIAHAQLTAERNQLDPGGYLAVVSDLLWSVKRDAALRAPARLFEVVPGIVQTLRRGLQMLGKQPDETETFFDALMRLHNPVLRLRRLRSARDAEASGFARLGDDSAAMPFESDAIPLEPPRPRPAEQPWLARQELAAAGFEDDEPESRAQPLTGDSAAAALSGAAPLTDAGPLSAAAPLGPAAAPGADAPPGAAPGLVAAAPATPDLPPLELPAAAAAAVASPAPPAPSAEEIEARTRAQLARLRTGDWVDLKVRGQWRRAQLHWTSDNGALFMFISRGGRPHSMTRRTCEKLLRRHDLRPVDAGAVVDKALRRLADPTAPEPAPPAPA